MKSEIRKAYFLNKYAIITPGRERRPRFIIEQSIETADEKCVFCPENLEKNLLKKKYGRPGKSWQMAILKNKYPSVTPENSKAYGIQEVLVETPRHHEQFTDLPLSKIELYLKILADRLRIISKNKRIEYILQFKNDGSKAGATVRHAHSQIFATKLLPPDVREELELADRYRRENNGACPYCDILKKELGGKRKILSDGLIGAFAPYASEYHYEAWLLPKRHVDNIAQLTGREIRSLAKALKLVLAKVHGLHLAYNFFMHQVISYPHQHFCVKVQPRDSNIWAGVELGSGMVINSVPPEKAAAYYRG